MESSDIDAVEEAKKELQLKEENKKIIGVNVKNAPTC